MFTILTENRNFSQKASKIEILVKIQLQNSLGKFIWEIQLEISIGQFKWKIQLEN